MSTSKITAQELRKLNTPKKAAIAYRGKVYNVTSFLEKHPGGSEQLLLAAGRDVTYFFDSYHSKETRRLVAQKCKYIGDLQESPNSPPKYLEPDVFYTTLEERVKNYFKSNNLDPKIHFPFFCASAVVVLATLVLWCAAVLTAHNGYSLAVSSFIALLSGFSSALVAFHSHDISHFSWTHKPWVWKVLSNAYCSVNGISAYIWYFQHMVGHHVHPNHDRLDPDVAAKEVDIWRIKPFQRQAPHYVYQYIYLPFLLNLISIKMKFLDFRDLIVRRDYIPVNPPTRAQLATFLATKAIHFTYRVVIPAFYISWPSLLLLNLLSELVMGFWMGFVTQVNHLNTAVLYPDPDSSNFDISWSEMQIKTTVDYATDSVLWNFLTGGLNSQVIHHLFPWILSVYYKDLNPILVETCSEFGVKYKHFSSMWTMWSSYNQYLKDMGQTEPCEDIKSKVF